MILEPEEVVSLLKLLFFFALCYVSRPCFAMFIYFAVVYSFRYAIAYLKGFGLMSIQDNLCLCDTDKSVANVVSMLLLSLTL